MADLVYSFDKPELLTLSYLLHYLSDDIFVGGRMNAVRNKSSEIAQ